MFPVLTEDQWRAIQQQGTPVAATTKDGSTFFMILELRVAEISAGDFRAQMPGIQTYGEGDTRENAVIALSHALRSYIEAFD